MSEKRKEQSLRLLQAAYDRVATVGVSGLRTRDIAEGAGVNLATLHYCFENKEALLRALYRFILDKFREDYETILDASESPTDQIRTQTRVLTHFLRERPASVQVWRAFTGEAWTNPLVKEILREHLAERRAQMAAVLGKARRQQEFAGPPTHDEQAAASLLIALYDGLLLQWALDPDAFSPEEYTETLERWLGLPTRAAKDEEL
jgi:AcrR family transcriptional regulator